MSYIDILNSYEKQINNVNNKSNMKILVRKLFIDTRIEDLDFTEIIYENVIPRLEKIGVCFDRENGVIDYEKVLKEDY